jgi:uncharacterized membrane protein (DUF373 family)
MQKLTDHTSKILQYTSNFAHVVISLALVAATLLIVVFFFHEVYAAFKVHTLIKGFLHALGILLLLWTMVELINTEINFLRGAGVDVAVFVEVALVVVVREIIMLPVEEVKPGWIDIAMWVGAAALLGLTYLLVRLGQGQMKDSETTYARVGKA